MFIRTRRLLLRPFWQTDAAALVDAIGHYDVVKNLSTAPWPYSLQDAEQFIALCEATTPPPARFAILAMDVPEQPLVGSIGVDIQRGEQPVAAPELGYWITPPHQGHGFAKEAAQALLELAFLGLGYNVVVASCFQDNPASAQLLNILGFSRTEEAEGYCAARQIHVKLFRHVLLKSAWCQGHFSTESLAA